jgi:hypothetical protein
LGGIVAMRKLFVVGAVLAALASATPAAADGGCRAWGQGVAAAAQAGGFGALVSGIATSVPRPVGAVVLGEHAATCGS